MRSKFDPALIYIDDGLSPGERSYLKLELKSGTSRDIDSRKLLSCGFIRMDFSSGYCPSAVKIWR